MDRGITTTTVLSITARKDLRLPEESPDFYYPVPHAKGASALPQ